MRSHVLAILAALVAAGCLGSDAPGAAETASRDGIEPAVIVDPAEIAPDAATSAAAPLWLPGDAWAITTHGDTEEQAVLVVTVASGESYNLATTSESMAAWDAMLDVSYVGRIRASDLAGFQRDQPVKYFDFPLEEGKSWTTTWDGLEITLTATKGARGFDIVGTTAEGAEYVTYDFVPDLKWWSHIEFVEGYGFRVDRFTSEWRGELAQATANLVFEMSSTAPTLNPGSGAFTIAEGQSFAMVSLSGGGQTWARGFALLQPDGTPYLTSTGNFESSEGAGGYFVSERLPPTPGQWHITAPTAHDPAGTASVRVHEVAITTVGFA
jgi:hypothetical protein